MISSGSDCRRQIAFLLWEQGVAGSNPVAPTTNLPTGEQFLVGIFVIWPVPQFLPLERKLPQTTADNLRLRIRKVVYAFSGGAIPLAIYKISDSQFSNPQKTNQTEEV